MLVLPLRREPNANIRRLYAINIVHCCEGVFMPVIVPYYMYAAGVDFAGFMLAESIFAACIVLLEVPTGYLSDIWQRRITLIVSSVFWASSNIWLLFADTLAELILVQVVMALAVSFASGTIQAMLYEYLAEDGRESEFRRVEGRRFAYGFYTLALTASLAGLLYSVDPRLPVALSALGQLAMLALCLRAREPQRRRRGVEKHPLYDMMATMRYALYGHREIAAIIALASVMFAGTKLIMWAQQPYFEAAQIPVEMNGILIACAFLMIGISSQLAHVLERWVRPVALLGLILLAEILLAAMTGAAIWYALAPLLLVGQAMYGVANPVVADAISQRAEPERRATILSAQSLVTQMLFVLLSLPYGWLGDRYGIDAALLMLAGVLTAIGAPAWLLLRLSVRESR